MRDGRGLVIKIQEVEPEQVPVSVMPSKYGEIYDAIVKAGGQWISVLMDTPQSAHKLKNAIAQSRVLRAETRVNGKTVFARLKKIL